MIRKILAVMLALMAFALISITIFLFPKANAPAAAYVQGATPSSDWTSFILDLNNSRYQAFAGINASNVGNLTQRWFFSTLGAVTAQPVVQNGTVYFGDWDGDVYAVNLRNGSVKWEADVKDRITSTAALYDGVVYVAYGSMHPSIVALSEKTGNVIWQVTLNSSENEPWASPIIYNGLLYIGVARGFNLPENNSSVKGEMFALNASSGKVAWNFTSAVGNSGGAGIWGSVAIDPKLNSIYFGTGNPYVNTNNVLYSDSIISLNATSGSLNWVYINRFAPTTNDLDYGSTPNLFTIGAGNSTEQAVGLGSKDGYYYVVNAANGAYIRRVQLTSYADLGIIGLPGFVYPYGRSNPEVFIPSYYFNSITGACCSQIAALFPSNGTIAWQFLTNDSGFIFGSVAVVPGAIIFGDDAGNLYAISSSSGKQFLRTNINVTIEGGISVAEGLVLVPGAFSIPNETAGASGVYAFGLKNK